MYFCGGNNLTPVPEIVRFLVEIGVDVNKKEKDGLTALFYGTMSGHSTIIDILARSSDIDPDIKSNVKVFYPIFLNILEPGILSPTCFFVLIPIPRVVFPRNLSYFSNSDNYKHVPLYYWKRILR